MAGGTVAEGAAVDLVTVAARVACAACGHEAESDGLVVACPRCGATELELTGGDELVLESIQFEAPA